MIDPIGAVVLAGLENSDVQHRRDAVDFISSACILYPKEMAAHDRSRVVELLESIIANDPSAQMKRSALASIEDVYRTGEVAAVNWHCTQVFRAVLRLLVSAKDVDIEDSCVSCALAIMKSVGMDFLVDLIVEQMRTTGGAKEGMMLIKLVSSMFEEKTPATSVERVVHVVKDLVKGIED